MIILITTHAESGTGYLATSLGRYVDIDEVRSPPHVFFESTVSFGPCDMTVDDPSCHATDLGCH